MADYAKLILKDPTYDTEGRWVPKAPGGWADNTFILPTGLPVVATPGITVSDKFVPVEPQRAAIAAQLTPRRLPEIPSPVSNKTPARPAARPMEYTPPPADKAPAASPELPPPPTFAASPGGPLVDLFRRAVTPEATPMQFAPPKAPLEKPPALEPPPLLSGEPQAPPMLPTGPLPEPAARKPAAAPGLPPPPSFEPQAHLDDSLVAGFRSATPRLEAPPMRLPPDVMEKLADEWQAPPAAPLPATQLDPPEFLAYPGVMASLPKILAPAAPQKQAAKPKAAPPRTQARPPEDRTALNESEQYEWQYTTVEDDKYPSSYLVQPPAPSGNRIVVSIPDKKLVVYSPKGQALREYPVYVGAPNTPTPRGEFRIMEKSLPYKKDGRTVWRFGPGWLGFAYAWDKNKPTAYAGFHSWVYTKSDEEKENRQPGWKTSTAGCVQLAEKDLADFAKVVVARATSMSVPVGWPSRMSCSSLAFMESSIPKC
jgi:lipoprotein-anchoring transpeptidase ErfK/SrfK